MSAPGKVLAYCVLERLEDLSDVAGVGGQPVRSIAFQNLIALYSDFSETRSLNQEDALRFHSVLKSVFEKQAVVPFRFPTFLDGETALHNELRENHSKYAADLERIRNLVQMELRISNSTHETSRASGKDYLESKRQQARSVQEVIRAVCDSAADLISDSKERPAEQGIRFYALTKRTDAASFRERIQNIKASPALRILVSGPWPATEFLDD
ncbi:MAG: GvpL/GvpF family gas vesicle protein [Terriglobales bacterium]|jgi:hypothetical protein